MSVTRMIFPCRYNLQAYNYQPDNHDIKLQNGGFQVIRFFTYSRLSGSVARSREKQSAVFRRAAPLTERGKKHNIW